MNDKQQRFVQEYVKDFNATQAAIRAGYSERTAQEQGSRLLSQVMVQEAIDERRAEVATAAMIDAAWVLRQWQQIATADPNELMQMRRVNCRCCYGAGHQYQWSECEYRAAVDKAVESGKPAPDGMGGFGFDPNADPHPDCPECGGNGVEYVHVADTRKLTGAAKRLYAGVKQTKYGIEIITRDQDAALTNIARYLGMMLDRKEISGPGGAPVALAHISATDLTDDQLAIILHGSES